MDANPGSVSVRTVVATRYVMPLREGGSLPAIIEADDLGTYVLKFRGAGQGPKVLVAELIVGETARYLSLPMPEIVKVELDPVLGRSEPDPEIQALIRASGGLNLGMDYLPGSITYDPLLSPPPDADLASRIVWLDALMTNVDRTARNTNMLLWHRQLYLIDNGASLFFHHSWTDYLERSRSPFPQIGHHVLLPLAAHIQSVDDDLSKRLTDRAIERIVNLVPDEWLESDGTFGDPAETRQAYGRYLMSRLQSPRPWVQEAIDARSRLL